MALGKACEEESLAAVVGEAGISRESLYRALSPKGNPTLKTLRAVNSDRRPARSVRQSLRRCC